jgi:plasmid stabilization system protein ParE
LRPILFRVAAARDVEDAFLWYERQRAGLGEEFLAAVEDAVRLIESNPEAFPVVHRDARRALLRRFPYGLFYRVTSEDIIIVGCFHVKRNPTAWRSRN